MSDTLLRVEDLKIYYPVAGSGFGKKEFVKAVDGVTFEVKKGKNAGCAALHPDWQDGRRPEPYEI